MVEAIAGDGTVGDPRIFCDCDLQNIDILYEQCNCFQTQTFRSLFL